MIKLLKTCLATCTATLVAFCVFACSSDNLAGTAEEPNQSANKGSSSSSELCYLDGSSSSQDSYSAPHENVSSSSQDTEPSPHNNPISSSARTDAPSPRYSSADDNMGYSPIPASSSNRAAAGGGHFNIDTTLTSSLDDYLKIYNANKTNNGNSESRLSFDRNVLAYNVIYESCDITKDTCSKPNEAPIFLTGGLHKITSKELDAANDIYPITAKRLGGTLKSSEGCSLYMLILDETSPTVHVITQITKDSISLTNIYDNCDYERMPFDRYVGFLFEFCEELSENTKIVKTDIRDSTMKCGGAPYKEYVRK